MADTSAAGAPARRPALAALSERQWFVLSAVSTCAAFAMLAFILGLQPHERGQRLLLALLACGPILVLRRWPLVVLAIAVAAIGAATASGDSSLPADGMLAFTTYLTASELPRRHSIRFVVAAATVLGLALLYAAIQARNDQPAVDAIVTFLPLAAAWFIGDSIAARRRFLAGLAEQAIRERAADAERARQEVREERVRIARELHDVVAHTLTVMTVQAGVGRRLMVKRPEEAGSALASIEAIGQTAQEELRVVLGLLREEEAGAASLTPAPRLVDVKDLVETVRDSGTPVDLAVSGADRSLSPSLEVTIYRVVQEALTNVVKHAHGARTTVNLSVSEREVRVEVSDVGAAAGAGLGVAGHGILGMRERVAAFGGWLTAEPTADQGFRVLAFIPVEGRA
jgi:signal transduction histidine kinase